MPKGSRRKKIGQNGKEKKPPSEHDINTRKATLIIKENAKLATELNRLSEASGSQKENITSVDISITKRIENVLVPLEDIEIIDRQTQPGNSSPQLGTSLMKFRDADERIETFPNDVENVEIIKLFDRILYSEEAVSALPNRSWAIHCTDIPVKRIVVSEMIMNNAQERGLEPFYIKQIVFDEKLNFELFLLASRTVLKDRPSSIRSMTDFESLLDHVGSLKLCKGGPDFNKFSNISPECAYRDPNDKWRHNLCTLELSDGDICEPCSSLDDILKRHVQRLKSSSKIRANTYMIRRKRPGQSRDS